MVDGPTKIPASNAHLNRVNLRQNNTERAKTESESSTRADDSFEPSSELAAREAGQQQNERIERGSERGRGSASGDAIEKKEPITSSGEADEVAASTASQITENGAAAAKSQANLNQETVLNLIA